MKVYQLGNEVSGTVTEIMEALELFSVDELMNVKYQIMDVELKRMLNEYFKYRIKDYCKSRDKK